MFLKLYLNTNDKIMCDYEGFTGDTVVKNLPANAGNARAAGQIPGQENPLE